MESILRDIRHSIQNTDFWGAFGLDRGTPWREAGGRFIHVIARIAPDATLSSADSEMQAISSALAARYDFNKDRSVTLVPLREELTGLASAVRWRNKRRFELIGHGDLPKTTAFDSLLMASISH